MIKITGRFDNVETFIFAKKFDEEWITLIDVSGSYVHFMRDFSSLVIGCAEGGSIEIKKEFLN
jgi:hypothetical protein